MGAGVSAGVDCSVDFLWGRSALQRVTSAMEG